jgi:hypothetical protein
MDGLCAESLARSGAPYAVLSAGRYALPVRFRVREGAIECPVPAWTDLADDPAPPEVTLVAVTEEDGHLRWLFVRGVAQPVPDPDWTGLELPTSGGARIDRHDLYQLLRIVPTRIERLDEARGWGYRETVDL